MEIWSKRLFVLLSSLFVINVQSSGAFLDGDDEVVRGNNYIDKLLKDMLEENGHEYDPYLLDDSRVGFSKKVMFVNVSGEAKLHNGYITGLKTLHRPDNCIVEDQNDKMLVKADLGAGVLNFHYDGTVKFMNFGPTISVLGTLAYVEVHMEFTVDSKTGRNGKLKKFYIDDMKGMQIKITGLGPMNWALNYLISGVTSLFKGFVRNMIEKKIRNHIETRMPNYEFPVEIDPTEAPETEAPEPETEAPEPETEAPEPETEAPEPETEAPEPETEAPEPETEAPEPETEAPEPETEAPEPETEAPEPETEAPEPETEAPEPETEAPEPEPIPEESQAREAMRVLKYLSF